MFKKTKKALGLNISDTSIKVFQFDKKRKSVYPDAFGEISIPEGTIENSILKDKDIISSAIKKVISSPNQGRINTKYVIASLPESKCFLRIVKLPKMTDKEVANAVRYEAEQHIPLKIDQVYLDWNIINRGKDYLSILLVASPKELVDSYTEVLEKSDLIPIVIETESVAVTRSLISEKLKDEVILIVDLNERRTSFIIFDETIQFTADIPITGEVFTKSIMKDLEVDNKKAGRLKREVGLNKKDERLFKTLSYSADKLVEEINNTVDFYKEHSQNNIVDRIILCGESSRIPGIIPYITQKSKRPVEIGNPWVNIFNPSSKVIPPISKKDSQGYTTAIGLALRGILYEDYDKLTST